MKKYIILPVMAASLILASCSDVWTGGDLSASSSGFGGAEGTTVSATDTSDAGYEIARHAKIALGTTEFASGGDATRLITIDKASDNTEISVTVKSYAKLDEASIADALSFYTLKNRSGYTQGAPERVSTLPATILDISVSTAAGNAENANVTTVIYFSVDTSSVSKAAIAFFADAEKLRDVRGSFVLNGNQNEVCGEESDSLVRYIAITRKANDGTPEALSFTTGEDFAPKPEYTDAYDVQLVPQSNGKFLPTSGNSSYTDVSLSTPATRYNDGLSSLLNSMYKIQTMAPGDSTWVSTDNLTFTYDSSTYCYKGQSIQVAPGQKYRLVKTVPSMAACDTEDSCSLLLYGHKAYQNYSHSYTKYEAESTGTYFAGEPSYIIKNGEYANGHYSYEAITAAQKSILTVTKKGDGHYTADLGIMAAEELEFNPNAYSDFLVTDENLNLIPAAVSLLDKNTVKILLKNTSYTGKVQIWAGNNTKIKTNPNSDTSAVSFGIWKDSDYQKVSGYVNLYKNY